MTEMDFLRSVQFYAEDEEMLQTASRRIKRHFDDNVRMQDIAYKEVKDLTIDRYVLIVDTETANSLENPLVYDIGYIVYDTFSHKVIESRSIVVADIFDWYELMNTSYYAKKLPRYYKDLAEGTRTKRPLFDVDRDLKYLLEHYNIKQILAYNVYFDYKAIVTTYRYRTCSFRRYFPTKQNLEFIDILQYARHILSKDKNYRKFCLENGYLTSRNVNQYKAEVVYKYWFANDFIESHTALEDVMIEAKIFEKCFKLQPYYNGRIFKNN